MSEETTGQQTSTPDQDGHGKKRHWLLVGIIGYAAVMTLVVIAGLVIGAILFLGHSDEEIAQAVDPTETAEEVIETPAPEPTITAESEPTEAPEATPTSEPEATATPEPTVTPESESESLDKIITDCSPSCDGEAIPLAADYIGSGPHPIVLMTSVGTEHEWSDMLPEVWWPDRVEDVQLVAIIGPETEVVIQECPYQDAPSIFRYRFERSVRIVEASSGMTIDSEVLLGSEPRECQMQEPWYLVRLDGDHVEYEQVEEWLEPFVTRNIPQ